ncbi:MAG: GAF domain-containing protein [bacterium]
MKDLNLEKFFSKKGHLALLENIIGLAGESTAVFDDDGTLISGKQPSGERDSFPVKLEGKTIGRVSGGPAAGNAASIISGLIETWSVQRSLADEILKKYKEHDLLYNINDAASLHPKTEEIADFIINELKRLIEFDYASILIFNEAENIFNALSSYGNDCRCSYYKKYIEKINGKIFKNGRGEIINEIFEKENAAYSFMAVPLKTKEKTIGIINVCSFKDIQYNTSDFKILSSITSYIANSIEITRLYSVAYYDHLTGLPNRRLFEEYIEKAIARADRSGKFMAVCFMDLDWFKSINDNYGHDAGDVVLVSVAKRISASLRKSDMLTRLGGDEFIFLIEDLNTENDLSSILSKIEYAIGQPINIGAGKTVSVCVSIGVCLYHRECGKSSPAALINNADKAMYSSKERKSIRTSSWAVYDKC